MKIPCIIAALILQIHTSNAQIKAGSIFFAKDFSKEIALYNAKWFVMNEVFGSTKDVIEFEVDPLTAASSGELTTLVYKCPDLQKEGLILGFYGTRWNESGVNFQAYAFKDLPILQANELLDKIDAATKDHSKYIEKNTDNSNIYFNYEDITILIYNNASSTKLRVFWNGFDSEWDWDTFKKTQRRFLKKVK